MMTYYIYACTLTCAKRCNNKEYLLDTGELVKGWGGRGGIGGGLGVGCS
jgi:hypothetical protein